MNCSLSNPTKVKQKIAFCPITEIFSPNVDVNPKKIINISSACFRQTDRRCSGQFGTFRRTSEN